MGEQTTSPSLPESELRGRLSPSAASMLDSLLKLKVGSPLTLFQQMPEALSFERMVRTFRGDLYSAVLKRLRRLLSLSSDVIVTQRDMFLLVVNEWNSNISQLSETELRVLCSYVRHPSESIDGIASMAGVSYAQARRARGRLVNSGILRLEGVLNTSALGLERLLVRLENPSLVISSPYVEKTLFVDGASSVVMQVFLCPCEHVPEVVSLVRSLRSSSESATVWRLAAGFLSCSPFYYDFSSRGWRVDAVHLGMALRGSYEAISIGRASASVQARPRLGAADVRLIDRLRNEYRAPASHLAEATGLSESTVFKRRAVLTSHDGLVLPRARPHLPLLTGRVMLTAPPQSAGRILETASLLPMSFVSQIHNLESPSEARVIALVALPAESLRSVLDVMRYEVSAVDAITIDSIAAGHTECIQIESMYDCPTSSWRWNHGDFVDVRGYSVVRREAEGSAIPLDLVT
ncbi:MAG TPA: AsnC family protein [Candidatus Thorarchaeota archaeon]|nr:MAG: hypothetical protein DRO93_04155 [Candidatus Thorarchaeota archaeon]HDD67782.1 AsnC family protein [Candidatus Thorarchaeota archaeon]